MPILPTVSVPTSTLSPSAHRKPKTCPHDALDRLSEADYPQRDNKIFTSDLLANSLTLNTRTDDYVVYKHNTVNECTTGNELRWRIAMFINPSNGRCRLMILAVVLNCLIAIQACCASPPEFDRSQDIRNILTGSMIPDEEYCDQPYVVVTKDGKWVCILTTGPGGENSRGLHVVSTVSTDHGKTWTELVDVEASGERRSYWGVPFITPYGRIYTFYGWETEFVSGHLLMHHPKNRYVFKYSDDEGRTWSAQHYRIPIRPTAIEKTGKLDGFWGIDMPDVQDESMYFAYTKLAPGLCGQGWVLKSDNIMTEKDPARLHWELLPEGDEGIRKEKFGRVQEEHNLIPLGNNSLFLVYRREGYTPIQTYSRDGGKNWSEPEIMNYGPGRRSVKHPRACPALFKTSEGKYLFLFHNNADTSTRHNRNPLFITGGILRDDGFIYWSEPEVLLYDPHVSYPPERSRGISYPCFIEHNGRFWITETQKRVARVHEIDPTLLEGLWNQPNNKTLKTEGLVCDVDWQKLEAGKFEMPQGLNLSKQNGLTIEMLIQVDSLEPGRMILDSRDGGGRGILVQTSDGDDFSVIKGQIQTIDPNEIAPSASHDQAAAGSVRIDISDGKNTIAWDVDAGLIQPGRRHHLVFIVDAGPRIISVLLDGKYCDGQLQRKYGWGRYHDELGPVSGAQTAQTGPALKHLRIYNCLLRTSEATGNYNYTESTHNPGTW